jgi:hypothetical protein
MMRFISSACAFAAAILASSSLAAAARSAAAFSFATSGAGLNFFAEGFNDPSGLRFTPTGRNEDGSRAGAEVVGAVDGAVAKGFLGA